MGQSRDACSTAWANGRLEGSTQAKRFASDAMRARCIMSIEPFLPRSQGVSPPFASAAKETESPQATSE